MKRSSCLPTRALWLNTQGYANIHGLPPDTREELHSPSILLDAPSSPSWGKMYFASIWASSAELWALYWIIPAQSAKAKNMPRECSARTALTQALSAHRGRIAA